MPANLPPHYYELEREYKAEKDPREKLRLAKELMALMPKHKGTDKLQADLKAKISKLKKQIDSGGKKHGARIAEKWDSIEKEGAAQVILIGPPNSGKSTIVDYYTSAKPLIGDYPYTTREPATGMMQYETIQIQLIDTPPISDDYMENYIPNLVRAADLTVIVVDVSQPGFDERVKVIFDIMDQKRVKLLPEVPEDPEDPKYSYKKTVFAGHKFLDEGGEMGMKNLSRLYPDYVIIPSSILDDETAEKFKDSLFKSLGIIRVFTKKVGHDPDYNDPIILPAGGTVEDAAFELHKDFARKMQYAKIWGEGKYEGQRVSSSYKLSDGDIIEFRI